MRPDPGGVFASDIHRRVLAHLTTPDQDIGWAPLALVLRVNADPHLPFPPVDGRGLADLDGGVKQITEVLGELKAKGFAVKHKGNVWQMTQKGFDALTGPIANEPEPDAPVVGPARIEPTPIGK